MYCYDYLRVFFDLEFGVLRMRGNGIYPVWFDVCTTESRLSIRCASSNPSIIHTSYVCFVYTLSFLRMKTSNETRHSRPQFCSYGHCMYKKRFFPHHIKLSFFVSLSSGSSDLTIRSVSLVALCKREKRK
jgi:hypothetical protein